MTVDKPEKSSPSIIKTILQTLVGIVIFFTAATNLLVVYILFFPDSFPKPIYLVYQLPVTEEAPVTTTEEGSEQTPTEAAGFLSGIKIPFFSSGSEEAAPVETITEEAVAPVEMTPGQGYMLDTGTKIVNLAESGGKKFIRVTATLEFSYDKAAVEAMEEEEKTVFMSEFTGDLNSKLPVIDDVIVTTLSTKDYQSVYTSEGKELLRQQIIEAVNQRLPEYRVIYVYFKEFVMQ
ncbi:MAG: flagellar basal body-associated protein FliL [Anaerolineaceae bacterium]